MFSLLDAPRLMHKVQASWRVFKLNSLPFSLVSFCVRGIDYISKYFSKLISRCILCFLNPVYTHQNRDCFLSGYLYPTESLGLPRWPGGKESSYQTGDAREENSIPGSGRSPGVGNGNPLHGQISLAGYNPWSRKASDMTEHTHTHTHTHKLAHKPSRRSGLISNDSNAQKSHSAKSRAFHNLLNHLIHDFILRRFRS